MHWLHRTLALAQQALRAAGVDHALTGGLALSRWGVHRTTVDVDLLVDESQKEPAKSALRQAGFELQLETKETLYFDAAVALTVLLADRESIRNMLANAVMYDLLDSKCVRAEDLIGLKIQVFTQDARKYHQSRADIAALIKTNPGLNWNLVKEHADLFNQWPVIEAIRKSSL